MHAMQVISYYSARGGVSVVREESALATESRCNHFHIISIKYFWLIGCKYFSCRSTLVLREPGPADEGTYTCRPHQGMFRSAHTRLFMDQLASTATPTRPGTDFNCVILLVIHCIHFYMLVV